MSETAWTHTCTDGNVWALPLSLQTCNDCGFAQFQSGTKFITTGKAPANDANPEVDHPAHYNQHPSGVECIEIVRHMNFNLGNVVKYIWRDGIKDTEVPLQDLEKAAWYLNDEIERRKAGG